jgi:hypothetical protein
MSSYAGIYVNGNEICSYRNVVDSGALYLFSQDELLRLEGKQAVPLSAGWRVDQINEDEIDGLQAVVYRTTVGILRDRLDVLGFGEALAQQVFDETRDEKIERQLFYVEDRNFREFADKMREELEALQRLTYLSWRKQVGDHLKSKHARSEANWNDNNPLRLFEEADERVLLRAIVEEFDDAEIVSLDMSELEAGGWLDDESRGESSIAASWNRPSSPPIIITEGTFDAFVLQSALEILKPHLANYIRFLDYEMGNEGSASAAVRTLKSFAAAGISNRIVALLDNDSAAREALMTLRGSKIPAHYRVLHYPDLPLAQQYPTLGPQGNSTMDVNRLAGSIELYLGVDVLTGSDGALKPVQWTGYMGKIKSYQGEVVDKGTVQRAFRDKVKAAKANPGLVAKQDWSGLELILARLMETLRAL